MTVGQTLQFAAFAFNVGQRQLSGYTATWSSSNTSVFTVSSAGLVTAAGPGSADVIATIAGISHTSWIGVTGTATTSAVAPSAVSDLSVTAVTDTSATLSFTQVANGAGGAANYDVRFALSPISWGGATSATRGTCTTPVVGTAVGNNVTCTVFGLTAVTSYQFQLISFRGTLNVNAVFSPQSNVASATTAQAASAVVASVTVSPATATATVGTAYKLSVVAKDSHGNVLTGRIVTWRSSNTAVVKVDSTGASMGLAAGAATLTATVGTVSGSSSITEQSATGSTSTGGSGTVVFQDNFESGDFSHAQNGVHWSSVVSLDVTSAISHGGTHAARYREGDSGDWAELRFDGLANLPEVYMQYYLYLPSGNESPSVGPKARIIGGLNDKFFRLWGGGDDGYNFGVGNLLNPFGNKIGASTWGDGSGVNGSLGGEFEFSSTGVQTAMGEIFGDNDAGNVQHASFFTDANRGRWVQIRIRAKNASAANNDGVLQMWIDGNLVISWTTLHNGNIYGVGGPTGYTTGYILGWANNGWPAGQYVYLDDFTITTGGFGAP